MSGRRGTPIITVAMALVIALCGMPAHVMANNSHPAAVNTAPLKGMKHQSSLRASGLLSAQPEMPTLRPMASVPDKTAPAYAFQQIDDSDSVNTTPSQTLQGTVTSIHVTQGRSQIVKFAQPIARMSIAQPEVADLIPLSPDQLMINGKVRGVTSLIVWDEDGQEGIFDLYVQKDSTEVLDAVAAIALNEKIQARVTDDSFILTGQVSSSVVLDQIRQIAAAYGYPDNDSDPAKDKFKDLTETPVPQVMLEVRIAEANRSVARQLKTSFDADTPNQALNLIRLANPIDGSLLSTAGRSTAGLRPDRVVSNLSVAQAGTNIGGLTGSMYFGKRFSMAWDMLETSGKINTLANPTLVCTHGRTASFLAGGEFPFRSGSDQNGQPIVSFKEFGVKLNFTPWISPRSGLIEMRVEPEVSNRDTSACVTGTGGDLVCGVATRKTSTTVQMKDGETLMISGLMTREEQNNFQKVPFIGEVPVLGAMFKNGNMNKLDRELIVIITPHIVSPADEGRILGAAP